MLRFGTALFIAMVALLPMQNIVVRAQAGNSTTGVPEVDSAVSAVTSQNLEAVLSRVEFTPQGCVPASEATVGSPPTCDVGQAPGTLVDSFFFAGCEGTFVTTAEQVRAAVANLFAKSQSSSLFAVARGGIFSHAADGYLVAISPGAQSSGDVTGSIWYVTPSGKIDGIDFGCPPQTLDQYLSSFTPPLSFVVAPGTISSEPTAAATGALPQTGSEGANATTSTTAKYGAIALIGLAVLILGGFFAIRRRPSSAKQ
jgi:hypothetical protein